jgi:hypothetical protein
MTTDRGWGRTGEACTRLSMSLCKRAADSSARRSASARAAARAARAACAVDAEGARGAALAAADEDDEADAEAAAAAAAASWSRGVSAFRFMSGGCTQWCGECRSGRATAQTMCTHIGVEVVVPERAVALHAAVARDCPIWRQNGPQRSGQGVRPCAMANARAGKRSRATESAHTTLLAIAFRSHRSPCTVVCCPSLRG